ncbi:hypothetical protein NM688_g6714 [Phlebia brevispora]|uniref:Uncharacterized protein n=1 Tax=Phlebia brevispora TaxID=194682 RepID=A0ACC1SD78_9APHY|nr:hypothetical protein NM688_g6714 [Phlebia brevispora]
MVTCPLKTCGRKSIAPLHGHVSAAISLRIVSSSKSRAARGFYESLPVTILVDCSERTSRLSTDFVLQHALPATVTRRTTFDAVVIVSAAGTLEVLATGGRYRTSLPLTMSPTGAYDVVLGSDWMSAVSDAVENGLGALPTPHGVWVPDRPFVEDPMTFVNENNPAAGCSSRREGFLPERDRAHVHDVTTAFVDALAVSDGEEPDVEMHCTPHGDSVADQPLVEDSTTFVTEDDPLAGCSSRLEGSLPERGRPDVQDVSVAFADAVGHAGFMRLSREQLFCRLQSHGLVPNEDTALSTLQEMLILHLESGECIRESHRGCICLCRQHDIVHGTLSSEEVVLQFRVQYLQALATRIRLRAARAFLRSLGLPYETSDSLGMLRRRIRAYVSVLKKAKYTMRRRSNRACEREEYEDSHARHMKDVCQNWPRVVGDTLKEKLVKLFHEETSADKLRTVPCACCAESVLLADSEVVSLADMPLDLLVCPEYMKNVGYELPLPFANGPEHLKDVLLDPEGVTEDRSKATMCSSCLRALRAHRMPDLALANGLYVGPRIPPELDLTIVEEVMIALSRAKCCIIHLKDENEVKNNREVVLPNMQRALKGNIIIHPQRPGPLVSVLPASIEDTLSLVCVIFAGTRPPTREWLRDHAKPLAARPERLRRALYWLKANNPEYRDVEIDEHILNELPQDGMLPFSIETVSRTSAQDSAVSRYDATDQISSAAEAPRQEIPSAVTFQSVVLTDVNGTAPANELRAAAVRHVKEKGGAFLQYPHDPCPVNEFCDPSLLPKIFPTLFPYGVGGAEHPLRKRAVSFKRHIRHLMALADDRFQVHRSFLFIVFNILQRREILLKSKLKVKKKILSLLLARRCEHGQAELATNDDERVVLRLMKEVRLVTGNVAGTQGSRLTMRNQIRATMTEMGPPAFYLTINPADLYNPIVRFLAGKEILSEANRTNSVWDQSLLVARNPFIASRFFDICMKTFIKCILRYDPESEDAKLEGGILGHVKSFYGCVESQGRGTLHCHMVIWVEGGLDPNQIRDRVLAGDNEFAANLIQFLDDTVSTEIPAHPDGVDIPHNGQHPCSMHGPLCAHHGRHAVEEDLHHLARKCQTHKHTLTCYKYCKPGEPRTCRFDLDKDNVIGLTTFNDRGELTPRCLDGMVNNFNATILRAMRCNMDIKFISSGEAAKAVIFYITDYITKSEMKAHVAYAALELAIKKLATADDCDDPFEMRAKRLLQKCAFALVSHQEMPAPQVAMLLENHELCYRSHQYANLYWTSVEGYLESLDPSPECSARTSDNVEAAKTNDRDDDSSSTTSSDADTSLSDDNFSDMGDDDADVALGEEDTDEVTVATDLDGSIVPVAEQVSDYIYRGTMLNDLCMWDFIRSVEKTRGQHSSQDEDHALDDVLCDSSLVRPGCSFLDEHTEATRRYLKILHPSRRYIVVPIGPALPRRDQPDIYSRYCRIMLSVFKPWRKASDLREPGQSWKDAFEEFESGASADVQRMLYNIQFLYECKDSREDHFRNRAHLRKMRLSDVVNAGDELGMDSADNMEDVDLLAHVDEVFRVNAPAKARSDENVLSCLSVVDDYGLYSWASNDNPIDQYRAYVPLDRSLEKEWEKYYNKRRSDLKRKNIQPEVPSSLTQSDSIATIEVQSPLDLREALQTQMPLAAELGSSISQRPCARDCSIESVLSEWTLNTEQSLAFRIIASHVEHNSCPEKPLRMFLGGPGGTGKSRVIDALRSFFERRGEARRFRLASYTGVAARHISGMTLHAALGISPDTGLPRPGSKAHHDLSAMWEGVDFFFVDEVSMIGCEMLGEINEALILAKGVDEPFGGVHVVFAGDFAQLPPVGETRLFGPFDTGNSKNTTNTRKELGVLGKLLWLSVNTVVNLTEPMRQSGVHNQRFVDLLSRLRTGNCTDDDYTLLCTRIMRTKLTDDEKLQWRDAPAIVYDNATKDALNIRAVHAFARAKGSEPVWYSCTDKHKRRVLADPVLKSRLRDMHSGQTKGLLGSIPLIPGMKVIVTKNFDVVAGVVNGSVGVLRDVRYHTNAAEEKNISSCLVAVPDADQHQMSEAQTDEVPILNDTVYFRLNQPYSKKGLSIARTQIALQPAYAFTAHRVQGQTYDHVVVDLQGCRGSEAPYVMLSRATSLDGLLLLRPFDKNKICAGPAEGLRIEWNRLRRLELLTLVHWCTGETAERAQLELTAMGDDFPEVHSFDVPKDSQKRLQRLRELQNNVDRAFGPSRKRKSVDHKRRAPVAKKRRTGGA